MQLKDVFKTAVLTLSPAALAVSAAPAHADTYNDLPDVEEPEMPKNNLVARWGEVVQPIPEQPDPTGPLDRDSFEFDMEADMIVIQADDMDGEYAARVEEMANYYINEYGADPFVVMTAVQASRDVGVDATFVMKTIEIECSWDFQRYPRTSSARGPGILQGTWEDIARRHGDEWGFTVNTDRRDPYWGSLGAALYIRDAVEYIRTYYNGERISPQMVRGSFFWGNGGNRRVNRFFEESPQASARQLLTAEYRANPTIVVGTIEDTVNRVGQKVADLESYEEQPPIISARVGSRLERFLGRDTVLAASETAYPEVVLASNLAPRNEAERIEPTGRIDLSRVRSGPLN